MALLKESPEETDIRYMRRCIQLAENGLQTTSPNPMVGAVVVYDGKIIGEGYHIRPGEGHAEVNAVRAVKDENLLCHSTMYVSLEPCSHKGRTPSCADLIIEKGIPEVIIGCKDPFSKVNGNGIRKLKEAGVRVKVGILEEECRMQNRRFMTFHSRNRPYITLKWAESSDGFIDKKRESGTPQIFSTPHTSMLTHKMRAENEGILVGRKTALLDNPSLTVRHWVGKHPVRVVIDKNNSLPNDLNLFDGQVQTIVFGLQEIPSRPCLDYVKITAVEGEEIATQIVQNLYEKGIQSVLIEGGSYTLCSFLQAGLWDEAYVEKSTLVLHGGVAAPKIQGEGKYFTRFGVSFIHYRNLGI